MIAKVFDRARRWLGSAVLAGATAFAPAPAHAFLDTEKAWNDLLQFAVRQVNAPGEFEIELGQVTRPEDGFALISTLRIRDSDGVWLDAAGLLVDWNPTSLLRGRFAFETLSAERIQFLRPPIGRGDPPGESAQIDIAWPRPPVSLVVEKLQVDELLIEGGLLPQDLRAEIQGRFYDLDDVQETTLSLKRLDRPGDTIDLGTRIDFDDLDISFSLEAREAPGGLVAELAGLPETEAIELTAAAAGTPSELPFTLYADIGQIGVAEGEGVAQWQENTAVSFTGAVSPAEKTAERWRRALGSSAQLDLDAEETAEGQYRLNRLTLDSDALRLSGEGVVDTAGDAIDMAFDWAAKDIGALNAVIAPAQVAAVNGSARAVGRLSAPKVDVNALLRDLRAGFGAIGAMELRIDSAPEGEGTDSAAGIQGFSFAARAEGLALDDPALQQALGADPVLEGEGAFYGDEGRIALETLRVDAATIDLDGNATYDLEPGALNAELSGSAARIGPFLRAAGVPVDGAAQLALKIQNLTAETVERLFLNAQLTQLSSDDPAYAAVVGDTAVLEALLVESGPGVVTIERGFFESATLRADAKGTFSVPNDTVDLALDWRLSDAARLAPVIAPAALEGGEGTAQVTGTLSEPKAEIEAVLTGAAYPGYAAGRAKARIEVQSRKDLRVPFSISADLEGFAADDATLDALTGASPRIVASGLYDTATTLLTVEQGQITAAAGRFDLQGDINPRKQQLDITYDLSAPNLDAIGEAASLPLAGSVEAVGQVSGAFAAPVISTEADLRGFRYEDYTADTLDLSINTSAAEDGNNPFSLDLTATGLSLGDPGLDALVGAAPVVRAEGTYNPEGPRVALERFTADMAEADATASGEVDMARLWADLEFDLDAQRLDGLAPLLGTEIGGALSAQGRASGSLLAPEFDLSLKGEALRYGGYRIGTIAGKIDAQQALTGFAPFTVDLTAGDIDLGDPALGRLIGSTATIQARGGFSQSSRKLRLDALEVDSAIAELTAEGTADLGEESLDLDFILDAAALEPLSEIAGERMAGSLNATGTLSGTFSEPRVDTRLDGRNLRYGPYAASRLSGRVGVASAAPLPFDVDLIASGLDLGDPVLNGALGETAKVRAKGTFDGAANALRLDTARIESGAANLSASGAVNLDAARLDLTFDVDARALEPFAGLIGEDLAGSLEARGRASGPFTGPTVAATLEGRNLRYGAYSIASIDGDIDVPRRTGGLAPFSVDVTAAGIGTGDPSIDALIGGSASLAARGRINQDAQLLQLDSFQASTRAVTASGSGAVDLGAQTLDLAFNADATDLAPLGAVAGVPLAGSLKAQGTARGPFAAPILDVTANGTGLVYDRYSLGALDLDLDMQGEPGGLVPFSLSARAVQPRLGDPAIDALLGEAVSLAASGTFDQGANRVTLDDASVTAAVGTVRAGGIVDLAAQSLDLSYSATLPSLGMLQPLAGAPLGGEARLNGRLTGPFADPSTSGTLEGSGVFYDTYQLGALTARYDVARLVSGAAGTLDLDANTPYGPLTASAGFDLAGGAPRIDRFSVDGLGLTGTGTFRSLPGGLYEGEAVLNAADLSVIGAMIGQKIAGTADGTIRLTPEAGRQSAAIDVTATGVRYSQDGTELARIGSLDLDARVADALGADPRIDGTANAAQAVISGFPVDQVQVRANGPLSALDTTVSGFGGPTGSERLDMAARLALVGFPRGAEVSSLAASYRGARLTAAAPFRLTELGGGGWRAENLDLRVDDGEIVGSGEYSPAGVVAALRLRNVPLQLAQLSGFDLIQTGRLFGELNIDTRGAPRGEFSLTATVLRLKGAQLDDPFDITAQGTLDGEAANVTARMTSTLIQTPLVSSARVPLRYAAGSPFPVPDRDAPFTAQVDWSGDVSEFWAFVPAPDHVLSGPVTISARGGGTFNNPQLSGAAQLDGGRYQHLDFGTLLTDITARADFTQDGRIVVNADAGDGVTGGVSVRATYGVAARSIDANLSLTQAALVRRDDLTALVSGDASAKGTLNDLEVTGAFRTDFVELRLIGGLGTGMVVIDVIPVGETAPLYVPEPEETESQRISLDVSLDFPQQVFVRGRGLESEWGGQIRATGYASDPRVTGVIAKRRGWLDLLGRQFDLSVGEVRFTGPLDPFIRIRLQRQANDILGWLDVTGPASDLDIAFGSNPSLPPDEVLPRLLFGRSKQSLSALEAAQLAAGVATLLSGEAGALDSVRGALGVDVLRVESGDDGGTSVATGKYLSPGVFVGAKQSLTTGESSALVEIEVFDNIELEAELGAEESKASANWKLDY